MFIKLTEWLTKSKKLNRYYVGKVVDNNDPRKIGRVKVSIEDFLEGSNESLPWIYPNSDCFLGGKSTTMRFSVPEIDSEVLVDFPSENIYFGFYRARPVNENNKGDKFDEDYPESYGNLDSQGTFLVTNKTKQEINFNHVSGVKVRISKEGDKEIFIPADLLIDVMKDILVNASNDIKVEAEKNIDTEAGELTTQKSGTAHEVEAPAINIITKMLAVVSPESDENVEGSLKMNINIEGNVKVIGNIEATGSIIDGSGNTNHHSHG